MAWRIVLYWFKMIAGMFKKPYLSNAASKRPQNSTIGCALKNCTKFNMFEISASKHRFITIKIMIFWTEVNWLSRPKTMAKYYRNQNTKMPKKGKSLKMEYWIFNCIKQIMSLLQKIDWISKTPVENRRHFNQNPNVLN